MDFLWKPGRGQFLAPRALLAQTGVRGPFASFLFMTLRLLNEQAISNATGAGSRLDVARRRAGD